MAPAVDGEHAPTDGSLAAQNRLLSAALSAERAGQRARAARAFRALLSRYPDSALAPEARRGLARVNRE